MQYFNSSSTYGFISRGQIEYRQLNDNISKLIDELGDNMQKDLVTLEQKILLQFKSNLIQAQQNYRHLQKQRNDQVIKENILNLKNQQEKIFSTEQEKSLEMNKLYDRLKLDLKRSVEYQHELELEGKYLTRQCIIAKQKGQILDQEINQYLTNNTKPKKPTFQEKINSLPKIFKSRSSESPKAKLVAQDLGQKRLKTKKQSIEQFIDYISGEQTTLQKIVQYYDIDDCSSQKQKLNLVEVILNDKQFKKYIYKMLFKKGVSSELLK